MADRKISDLTALTTPASGDFLPIVDISEAAAASKNKRITIEELMRGVPDGTAAAPGIAFETDPNTGIYSPGADQLAVATNGVGKLFVDANGNVGLGVLNPTSTANGLDISSGGLSLVVGADNNQTTRTNATTKTSRIASFHYTNTEEPVAIAVADSTATSNFIYFGGGTSLCNAATELIFYTAGNNTTSTGSERLRITSGGFVGVGTSSPAKLLHVSGDDGTAIIRIANTTFGSTSFDATAAGLELLAGDSNTSVKYMPAIKFGSTDSSFTTTNPKFGAALTAEVAQDYVGDTTGGMHLAFWTAPINPGTGNGLVERLRITSAGLVGIGTSSPANPLHIRNDAGTPQIKLDYLGSSSTIFGSSDLFLQPNGATAMTLKSGGNVGIGTTSPEELLHIFDGSAAVNQAIKFGNPATSAYGLIKYSASGSEFLDLSCRGTTTNYGNIRFYTGAVPDERARIDSSGRLLVGTSTANANGGILQLTSGITFPATAVAASDANTLDDYEEGTWTGTLGGTTSESGQAYSVRVGKYVKVGKLVTISNYLEFATGGTGTVVGNAVLKGLPFVVDNSISAQIMWNRTNINFIEVYLYAVGGSSMGFYGATAAGTGILNAITAANLYGSQFQIVFSCSYLTT